jgi:hypothetical protein
MGSNGGGPMRIRPRFLERRRQQRRELREAKRRHEIEKQAAQRTALRSRDEHTAATAIQRIQVPEALGARRPAVALAARLNGFGKPGGFCNPPSKAGARSQVTPGAGGFR